MSATARVDPGGGPLPGVVPTIVLATLAAASAGVAVGQVSSPLWLAALAVPALVAASLWPARAIALYLLVMPLVVGIGRGAALPVLRPNEALLLLVLAGLALHLGLGWANGRGRRLLVDDLDGALVLLLAMTGSAIPLLVRYGRGLPISTDDVLYAMVLWKCWLAFRLARDGVTRRHDLVWCLVAVLAAAALVALIGIAQVLHVPGVAAFLWTWYDQPFTGTEGVVTERGTSTIASSLGVADIMAMALALTLAALAWGPARLRPWLVGLAGLYVAGAIAAGQFSGLIGLAVAVGTVALLTGRVARTALIALPLALVALVPFWPVIERRLAGFSSAAGLPDSWVARLDNLERFVLPELATLTNWLTGVRPAARIPAPEPWRDYVFIESGYVWLLWTGGIAMLLAFVWFVVVAARMLLPLARVAPDPVVRVTAAGAAAGLAVIVVLMALDPHLTMRGGADLFFPLLGLALGTASLRPAEHPTVHPHPVLPDAPRSG